MSEIDLTAWHKIQKCLEHFEKIQLLLLENQRAMMIDARMRYGPGDSMYEQWTAQLDATDAAIKEL